MLKPVIDWLAFTVKPDENAEFPAQITEDDVFGMLCFNKEDFCDIGKSVNYEHRYLCNNISVFAPYADNAMKQGWHISFSSQGLRFYEQLKNASKTPDFWPEQLKAWRAYSICGFYVHPTRIDIAHDDFDALLSLDQIRGDALRRDYVSQFRSYDRIGERESLKGGILGQTIYFGNRKSASFCRFYDKLAEQRQKHRNDPEELERLSFYDHWIRMEFEFKREQAMKLWNIICDAEDFSVEYSKVINSYLRFIDKTDSNVSRCPLKKWWRDFIGTVEKAKLSVPDYKCFSYQKTVKYFEKYLTTTLAVVLSGMPIEDFLIRIRELGLYRLKSKQLAIMDGIGRDISYTSRQIWDFLNPTLYAL